MPCPSMKRIYTLLKPTSPFPSVDTKFAFRKNSLLEFMHSRSPVHKAYIETVRISFIFFYFFQGQEASAVREEGMCNSFPTAITLSELTWGPAKFMSVVRTLNHSIFKDILSRGKGSDSSLGAKFSSYLPDLSHFEPSRFTPIVGPHKTWFC